MKINSMFKNFFSTKYFAFFIYLLLAIVFWGIPMNFDFISKVNIGGDPAFYLWSLKWWPYAISHGLNPFLTKAFWAPFGQNLAWTTSVPSIALLFSPVTVIFGPIFSYNLAIILSLSLGAFGVYLICKSLNLKQISSIFGGLVFFFSSYVWGQLLGHLNLDIVFAIPFLIYIFILRFKNYISFKKYLIFFSILLAFQFGVSNEIYATFVIFGFIALFIMFLIFITNEVYRKLIIKTTLESAAAVLISILLLSPYLYFIFYGYIKEHLQSIAFYVTDPLNLFIPTPITLLFGQLFAPISYHFTGNFSEEGAYLGLPLIFIIVSFIVIAWRSKNKLHIFLSSLLVVILVFSFGPYLNILGHQLIPMPWYIFTEMPLTGQALPTRFTLYIVLIASVMSAIWLEKININKSFKYAIAALVIIFLIPKLSMYKGSNIQYPAFISSGAYKKYIKQGENVIIFPTYAIGGFQGPLWQQKTNFYFNLSQEIAGASPKELILDQELKPVLLDFFYGENSPHPIFNNAYKFSFFSYLAKCNVGAIILPEDYHNPEVQKLLDLLNIKPNNVGGVIIYQINKNYINSALEKAHIEYLKYFSDIFSTLFSSSQKFLSDGGDASKLLPQYLEKNGYLDKSFGYKTGTAINWTNNNGWVGQWACPDGKGECFGVGILGGLDQLKPIVDKYKSESLQIFFPYPTVYDPAASSSEGQLLMIFKAPKPNPIITKIPYTISFTASGNSQRYIGSGFCNAESWGTWTCAKEVSVSFKFRSEEFKKPMYMKLTIINALVSKDHPQKFEFYLNEKLIGSKTYTSKDKFPQTIALNINNVAQNENSLVIKIPNAASPKSLGISNDTRELGIGLISIEFNN
ncbi:putative glycosyl transferase [Desulfurella amilsii]|uniref:Putative glycosyl transferase n=1 Tax=Desulfurella amilsii TaxID=1562698 RepID=A0A1X4XY09_9BACT|nr:hypothetical protein [Desulfurella amilsii]OSS42408.1 putative glycosyl transferase [Desulfurella amilsii]